MNATRQRPCVECGANVPFRCPNADAWCDGGESDCEDCAMLPALCQRCAARGLAIAGVMFVAVLLLTFAGMAAGVLCR